MTPSDVVRPARFSALAIPFLRRYSTAFSMSPAVSSSAFLHSIIPAPVRRRSSCTSFAVNVTVVSLCLPGTSTPPASHTGGAVVYSQRAGGTTPRRTSLFGVVAAVRGRLALSRLTAGLETCGNGFGLRATTTRAPAAPLVGIISRLDTTVRAVRRLLAFVLVGSHRRRESRLSDRVGDGPGDQLDRADRVIIAGDRHGDEIGIGVRVDDAD